MPHLRQAVLHSAIYISQMFWSITSGRIKLSLRAEYFWNPGTEIYRLRPLAASSDHLSGTFAGFSFWSKFRLWRVITSGHFRFSRKTDFVHRLRVKTFRMIPLAGQLDHPIGSYDGGTSFVVHVFGVPSHLGRGAIAPSRSFHHNY